MFEMKAGAHKQQTDLGLDYTLTNSETERNRFCFSSPGKKIINGAAKTEKAEV